jgi:tetratricopeptide (TPR) repeat protein
MYATIEWSYKLLTDEEKTLFKRLGVFSGGFQLEAVEEVCVDSSIPGEYVVDLISSLVDHSMIITIRDKDKPLRYNLLEPVKQFAVSLLGEREHRRISRKHGSYYMGIAEKAYHERLTYQAYWMSRLTLEHDNLMKALNWAEKHNFGLYSMLLGLLAWFWVRSNSLFLARKKLGDLIHDRRIKNETRARILTGYGWSLAGQADMYASLGDIVKETFAIWHRLGNLEEEVILRTDMAALYFGSGNDEAAVHTIMETYEIAQNLDNRGVLLYCLMYVAMGQVVTRRFDEARSTIEKMLELADELENIFAEFAGHHNLGDCALMEGKFEEAEREYGEGINITTRFGDMHYLYTDLAGVAMAVAGMGRYAKALRLMGGVNTNARRAGISSPENNQISFWQEQLKLHIAGTREKLGEALTRKYEAEGGMMDLDELIAYALDFEGD